MADVDDSHEFGSDEITEAKLQLVEKYLKAFSAALRRKFKGLWYIDAFAGTGSRTVKHAAKPADWLSEAEPAREEKRRGSATIAIEVEPKFDRLVFMETRRKHFKALKALQARHSDRDISVVKGDANKLIQAEIAWDGWATTRAVMFLDPYGMNVEWETLKAIAATKAIDVWYLFSLEGLYRQAARDIKNVDQNKRAALTRQLGTDDWEQELYATKAQPATSLFDDTSPEERLRTADVAGLERYVTERLRTIFPLVLEPYALPVVRRPQRFSLYFAESNDQPKALRLARKIGDQILRPGK